MSDVVSRIANKKVKFFEANGEQANNLVISIPVALELIHAFNNKRISSNDVNKLITLADFRGVKILGLDVTLLRVFKEILEVG